MIDGLLVIETQVGEVWEIDMRDVSCYTVVPQDYFTYLTGYPYEVTLEFKAGGRMVFSEIATLHYVERWVLEPKKTRHEKLALLVRQFNKENVEHVV